MIWILLRILEKDTIILSLHTTYLINTLMFKFSVNYNSYHSNTHHQSGLAYQGICDMAWTQSVSVDNGLMTAFTAAHELAHK